YRCRDISYVYDSISCDCGRTHRRLGYISGRVDDMIKVSGVSIWPSAVESVLLKYPELGVEYQIIVSREEGRDRVKVVAELNKDAKTVDAARLRKKLEEDLRETLMTGVEVQLVEPLSLQRQEVGKAKRVVDMRS
ncbi:MAG: hypothetical protein RMH74_06220, partial [Candidatus Caldarchaeum sp.]|nr:hypothetical protein [Candidatus Caldarchaeum sp.]